MDPDFGVYVTNEKGTLLGIAEIRSRLIAGEPLVAKNVLNTGRNIFTEAWANLRDVIDGTNYLWYLRKNIFKVRCPQVSMFGQRSKPNKVYFELIPDGYRMEPTRQKDRHSGADLPGADDPVKPAVYYVDDVVIR
jgi:hypothetical protein